MGRTTGALRSARSRGIDQADLEHHWPLLTIHPFFGCAECHLSHGPFQALS
jgi:hypothetical protein